MKKFILLPFLYGFVACIAQDKLDSNGFNLEPVCAKPCNYFPFQEPIYFPFQEDKEWQINNFEVAIKPAGSYLITGDLHVLGVDTAINLQIEFLFFDKDSQTIHVEKPDKFEFFNEPNQAEPFFFAGELPKDVVKDIKYVDVGISLSQRLPYYEISSNCFRPCKNLRLKDAIKAFKKKK